MYRFEWDEKKNRANIEKHGISFEEARTVFYDEYGWMEYDDVHSSQEDRFRLLGCSTLGNVLIVVHCVRDNDKIRIISSRRATSVEEKGYQARRNGHGR